MVGLPSSITIKRLVYQAEQVASYLDVVSEVERARIETFGSEKRQHEHLLGRVALRQLVAEHTGATPQGVNLHVPKGGWVEVDVSPCWLSVSHSGDHAFAALATHPVGVDIEMRRTVRDDLHRFLLHREEYWYLDYWETAMGGSGSYDDTLIRLWSIKEAVLKARRTGFRMSPKKIRIKYLAADEARLKVGKEEWCVAYGLDTHAWAVAWPASEATEVSEDG
ncbi:MAG: 4'-phosphopantetheinyl transferase superfamily protein [Rhodothermales bacterium]